jgi:menaquinone-dependent protoporphyrinogen oxidase
MTQHIALIYSTTDGHTLTICRHIQQRIESTGRQATLIPIRQALAGGLAPYDKLVIGASIRYGHHTAEVGEFIRANADLLESKPSAFFSVNLVARKPGMNRPDTNPYARRFLKRLPWRPRLAAVFAGKLNYPGYRPLDRMIIRLIMRLTGGPTDPKTVVEYTDWQQVADFAEAVCRL